jgi:hypothetical protein
MLSEFLCRCLQDVLAASELPHLFALVVRILSHGATLTARIAPPASTVSRPRTQRWETDLRIEFHQQQRLAHCLPLCIDPE